MEVTKMPISQFLQGQSKTFVIPVFQRDYAWKISNCEKLWSDLTDLKTLKREDHFLGTIVTIGQGFDTYSVIDGQQRLTTVSILLIALYNYLKKAENKDSKLKMLQDQVLDFLVNKYADDEDKKIRLKPNKSDKSYFAKLFEYNEHLEHSSNIISNYDFFYRKIESNQIDPRELFDLYNKIKIVLINLDSKNDDPQLIFESLNSTGVGLTAGDLIRNYILMDLEPNTQDRFFNKYWIQIEKLTSNLPEFIRNYLIFKTQSSIKKEDVYSEFKILAKNEFKNEKENILKELIYYAGLYSSFTQIEFHENSKINEKLSNLNKIEFSVCIPYLFDLFTDFDRKNITEDVLIAVLITVESYAFRKMLVDNSTQGLNKLFVTLSKDLKKHSQWKEQYLELLNFILLEKRGSQRFPTDIEFETALINKEVYKLQSKNRNYLLESLENFNCAYRVNLEDLTIEHILPQKLTDQWKKKLGTNWQDIHNKYLHTLGNLSLTGNNSKLSNLSFEEKQKIDLQTSKLKLNFKFDKQEKWTETEILARAKSLISDALKIWTFPTTSFKVKEPEEIIFDLSSEDQFSNTKPTSIIFGNNNPIQIATWREILRNVCSFLYEYSPTEFNAIRQSSEFSYYFDDKKPMMAKLEFSKDIFVECQLSANMIFSFLSRLCKKIGYDPELIQITLKSAPEKNQSSD